MKVTTKELDDKDRQIIKLLMKRVTYNEVAKIVFLTPEAVRYRVRAMRDYYDKGSLSSLIDYLTENELL